MQKFKGFCVPKRLSMSVCEKMNQECENVPFRNCPKIEGSMCIIPKGKINIISDCEKCLFCYNSKNPQKTKAFKEWDRWDKKRSENGRNNGKKNI